MNKVIERLFSRLPSVAKDMLISFPARRNMHLRYGAAYLAEYEKCKQREYLSLNDLEKIQLYKLKHLVVYAYNNVKYYRQTFSRDLIDNINDFASVDEILNGLPILTKQQLRKNNVSLISVDSKLKTVSTARTSGTTGSPVFAPYDSISYQKTFATMRLFYDWMGLPKEFRSIRFSGNIILASGKKSPPYWVYSAPNKQLFMSTYHICDKTVFSYVEKIKQFKPHMLDGYPSAIYQIARHINENHIDLQYKPICVATTSEHLNPAMRKEIEQAFGCKVYNQYASAEGAPFIFECEAGGIHLYTDSGCFELLNDSDQPANAGESARMVVTSFRNLSLPLIRYDIGDRVTLLDKTDVDSPCPCGRFYPRIKSINGRQDDMLMSASGEYLGMVSYRVFKEASHIRLSQIRQLSARDIEVRIVPGTNYGEEEEKFVRSRIEMVLGKGMNIQFQYEKDIELGSNGKFKSTICLID